MDEITFAPLGEDDLPLLSKWLSDPIVSEWYSTSDSTLLGVRAKYLPRIRATVPVKSYIASNAQGPIGFAQAYWFRDYPLVEVESLQDQPQLACIDVLLGGAEFIGRGHGQRMIRAFLHLVVFGTLNAQACIVDPSPHNSRAIRAYERVGFKPILATAEAVLMLLHKFELDRGLE